VTEETSTEPVIASDLRVGDVIRTPDGRHYAVDTQPEPNPENQEYPVPHIFLQVTEMNADLTEVEKGENRLVLAQDADLDVLSPRPAD
jgi:hypothetical protein